MDMRTIDRWIEVSFYYFCKDLLAEGKDLFDIIDLVEGFAKFGNYDTLPVRSIIQDTLITYKLQPTKEELVLLMFHNGLSIRYIKTELKVGSDKIYQIIDNDKRNPRVFYPRIHISKLAIIKKFLDAHKLIKGAGFR